MDIKLDSLLIAGLSMNDKEALLDYFLEIKPEPVQFGI